MVLRWNDHYIMFETFEDTYIYINSVLAGGEPEELFGPLRIILHDSLSEKFIVTNLFRETSS